jgi:predicted flap endonuclease-1-like 5' DNA nuclease
MGLISAIKSLLGIGDSRDRSHDGTAGTDVTVERETDASSERAVKESDAEARRTAETAGTDDTDDTGGADVADDTGGTDVDGVAEAEEATNGETEPQEATNGETEAQEATNDETEPQEATNGETEPREAEGSDTSETADSDEAELSFDNEMETTPEDGVGSAEEGDDSADGEPVDHIKGIGPSYSEQLTDAGVRTVSDLADADAAELNEATGIGENRIQGWIDRANAR